MGQKTVRFSDLSGQLIIDDIGPARVVIREHPGLAGGPVEVEALADEVRTIEKSALAVAVLDLYFPGEEDPRRVAVDAGTFDAMATDTPMSQLLATARPARRASRTAVASGARDGRVDYATLEHAGAPHKGKTTEVEKQLVRDHLDQVNQRLAAQGLRTISPDDPEHAERYGLTPAHQAPANSGTNG